VKKIIKEYIFFLADNKKTVLLMAGLIFLFSFLFPFKLKQIIDLEESILLFVNKIKYQLYFFKGKC